MSVLWADYFQKRNNFTQLQMLDSNVFVIPLFVSLMVLYEKVDWYKIILKRDGDKTIECFFVRVAAIQFFLRDQQLRAKR